MSVQNSPKGCKRKAVRAKPRDVKIVKEMFTKKSKHAPKTSRNSKKQQLKQGESESLDN